MAKTVEKRSSSAKQASEPNVNSDAPADPSERFLKRKAEWRAAARASANGNTISAEDFNGWFRGKTDSEAFRPSRQGLKKS